MEKELRSILHVDMDAFYASVEQRDAPQIRGKPVIVGGTGKRGVVAAASYEVRKFGVHSAMPMREALQRCPHAICIHPRMAHYQAISAQIFGIFRRFTPLVEGLSLDEAFLDVSASRTAFGSAAAIARKIKDEIHAVTELTASVGAAPNKLVAKIASDLRKPDGLVVVSTDEVTALLDPLPVTRLFGIGKKTAAHVHAMGIDTFGDLRAAPESTLRTLFGRYASQIRERASGIDHREVIPDEDYKQISAEETFDVDITDLRQLRAELWQLADRVGTRVRGQSLLAGCVTVKIRRFDFKTYTRQQRIQPRTCETRTLAQFAERLLTTWLQENDHPPIRLIGVGASDLGPEAQPDLFNSGPLATPKLDDTVDKIREKFGKESLSLGSSLRNSK